MAQRQFKSDDTSQWDDRFGSGADGAYTTAGNVTDSARTGYSNTSITGTSGETAATAGAVGNFVAGDLVVIHQSRGTGAGNWELNKISSTGAGTNWTLAYALCNTYASPAQVYRLLQYSAVTIDTGHTLTGVAWGGTSGGIVALLCNGTTTVTGNISVVGGSGSGASRGSGGGFLGGLGQSTATDNQYHAYGGEGTGGNANTVGPGAANISGGGGGRNGGGAGGDGGGGGGGNSNTGTNGASLGGTGGASVGNTSLTSMVFGGAGGGGGGGSSGVGGAGGNSGAIVILISKVITITGTINVNGGASGVNASTGGGGGSGGSILLKGQTLTLGSTIVTAIGGTAGGNPAGGAGSVGRIHADYSTTIGTSATNPTLDSTLDTTLKDSGPKVVMFI